MAKFEVGEKVIVDKGCDYNAPFGFTNHMKIWYGGLKVTIKNVEKLNYNDLYTIIEDGGKYMWSEPMLLKIRDTYKNIKESGINL